MENQFLKNLFLYKKTAVLLAAFQLGIFRKIKEHGYLNKELCCQLEWNEKYIELLCLYLADEGYLANTDGKWQINKEFKNQLNAFEKICKHESYLYHKWLTPEMIVSSIRSAADERPFDKEGFSREEQDAYNNTMYGNNVNLIAFHLLRKIKQNKLSSVRCMEYGRSAGTVGQALKKHIPELHVDIIPFGGIIESQSSYDLILIYNTIHYKPAEEWIKIFLKLKELLCENGVICIADAFYEKDNNFRSTVLLDWITHGGIHNIYSYEIVKQLNFIGFTNIEQLSINAISTDLLLAYKQKAK